MGARPDKGRKLRVVTLIDQLGITGGAERIATEVVDAPRPGPVRAHPVREPLDAPTRRPTR